MTIEAEERAQRSVPIAVVIPVHNRREKLQVALESVLAQTISPAEIIVVDDGSTDGSGDLAAGFGVRVLRNEHRQGSGVSRNRGIEATAQPWIAFLDSDDRWAPDHVERLFPATGRYPFVSSRAVDTFGRFSGNVTAQELELTPRRCLEQDNPVVTSSVIASRALLARAGLFPNLPRAQDLALWLRVLKTRRGVAVPATTVFYEARRRWETDASEAAERDYLQRVLAASRSSSWFTARVDAAVRSRQLWDQARRAQHERRYLRALVCLGRLSRHPAGLGPLMRTLRTRRQARRLIPEAG